MLKLDAHQHFWDLGQLSYPWLSPEAGTLYRNYAPSDLEPFLSASGVSGTIAVQATSDEAETDWLLKLARQHDFIKGVVGWVDLTAPDLADRLAHFQSLGPLCGVRHQIHDEADPEWVLQPAVVRGLQTVADTGLAYDLLVRPIHLPHLPKVFDRVPNARWVIDHAAKPLIKSGQLEPWFSDMRVLATYPNVVCKVSGLITEADHISWTTADIRTYFERVLELFGPSHLLWGSDWPVCLLAGSYERVQGLVQALAAALSADEQADLWGKTAQRIYAIKNLL